MNQKPTNQNNTMSEQPTEYTTRNATLHAAFAAGQQSATPFQLFPGLVGAHKDTTLHDVSKVTLLMLKATTDGPENPAGVEILQTPLGFAAAVLANQDCRTRVWADAEKWKITAVFDYLEDGGRSYANEEEWKDGRRRGWG